MAGKKRLDYPLFLTPHEAAEILNISVYTVRERIGENKLPVSPHGSPHRVDRDELFRLARKYKKDSHE